MGEEERQFRAEEREGLRLIIQQWNSNRLDLFEISEPDENLVFTGVMRFYFQDCGQKVATKCIRVSSTATTRHVIETLIEKFRPDMRMLSIPEYTLYEIHENGEERRLAEDEKPLLVQLNWNKDDREGRFLLRRMDFNGKKLRTLPPVLSSSQRIEPTVEENFTRKSRLSRRERKELLKQEKLRRTKRDNENDPSVAETLYTELPETSFTRSISNPEAVMRRRRAQKLEKKLQQFRSKDGGPDTGGTLKIYGESLCQDVPYKTLLLSVRDTSAMVVKEMLEKYGLIKEDYTAYCLVQCIVTAEETVDGYQGIIVPQKEYILDDDECPLAILMNHPPSRGSIMFQVRRRPADHSQRRRKKKPLKGTGERGGPNHHQPHRHPVDSDELLPFLVEIGPNNGDYGGKGRQHKLHLNVTEVGSDRCTHTGGQSLQIFGPHIQSRHCVIAHTDGIVTVTPCSRDAETYVDFHRIFETTILQHGSVVRFGRNHDFQFIDPQLDDRLRHHMMPPSNQFADRSSSIAGSQTCIARPPGRSSSEMQLRSPLAGESWNNYERYGPAKDPILPAVLEFREDIEDAFLHAISTQLDPTDVQFKLAPTYTLYMAARFRASTHYRPELAPMERAQKLTVMLSKVSHIVHDVIEVKQRDPTALAFWMANASELLHFLKQDRHICGYSLDAQDILAEAVQFAFRKLVEYMQMELSSAMPLFLEDRDDCDEEEGCTAHILSLLTNTMALLRRCRVNAALTIQLFSQLFHYVNMWVFNKVVTENSPNYCTRIWGERIKERLARIELWAEKQGLELAADCHLAKLSQAALLLISTKNSPDDVATLSSTCFKLNSLQLSEILQKYDTEPGESHIPNELIESVVAVAETTADGLAREDGREIRLEEEADLQLPFLLPEDGYSCDIVRGVPSGLAEFLEPLQMAQLCRMTPQPTSSGYWTIYMQNQEVPRPPIGPRSPSAMSNRSISIPRGEPEVHTIQLHKSNSGMGLSIVATKGENQDQLGIYIKSVVPGGAAHQDGRLQAGDQLLSVDGKSLVGISQEEAAQYMVGTGPVVSLEVARQGALYHGLAPLLSQPSPQDVRVEKRTSSFLHGSNLHIQRTHQSPQPYYNHSPDQAFCYLRESKSSPNISMVQSFINASLPTLPQMTINTRTSNHEGCSKYLDVGIKQRNREETNQNPNFPKYTFTPSTGCNSKDTSCSWQQNIKHGMACKLSKRRVSGPANIASDSGIDLSYQMTEDSKPWRSLGNIHNESSSVSSLDSPTISGSSQPNVALQHYKSRNYSLTSKLSCPLLSYSFKELQELPCTFPPENPSPRQLIRTRSSPILNTPPESTPRNSFSETTTGIQDTSILHNIPSNPEFPKQPTHHQPHYPHPHNMKPPQARMQPSKSVPSLITNDANLSYKASGPLNTSYSRTSSSTSLSQSLCPQRSRSTQNLNEGGPLTLIGRHPSSPSLVTDDDRFYQNVSFHQGPQDPRKGSQRGGRPPIFEGNIPSTQHEHRPDIRPMSAFLQREEMAGRDNMQRPTSQQNIRPDPRFATVIPDDPRRKGERTGPNAFPMANPISQSSSSLPKNQNLRVNLKYPGNPPVSQNPASPRGTLPSQLSPHGYPHSPSMVVNAPHTFSPQMNPQFINQHNQNTSIKHVPPPTAPKPFRDSGSFGADAPEKPSRQFGFDIGPSGPPRPPPPEDGYRESPPPPPPPASTHPLLQPNGSVLESNPSSAKALLAKGVKGPWDRDEKEQYERRKREAARRWRDEQISALENMERKTLQEEEMMNTLKLEREFQKRAEEAQRLEDDEDEDDDDEDDDDRERINYDKRESNWSQMVNSQSIPHNADEQNEENSSNKVDEIKRKQEEFEAAREAEELLLREAQRRQDEEMRRQQHQQQHQYRASQRLDSLLGSPVKDSQTSAIASPSPPERGSSFSVSQQSFDPIIGPRSRPGDSGTVKKVQFSEPFSPSESYTYDNNANQEKIREDPNSFFDEAETLLNYTSPNRSNENTPGVIGAQEVYRDPRQRRLLEQAQKAAATRNSGQEKLTFREKMKMFAMETEEGNTPKDKLKHSKAQREIEHSS